MKTPLDLLLFTLENDKQILTIYLLNAVMKAPSKLYGKTKSIKKTDSNDGKVS